MKQLKRCISNISIIPNIPLFLFCIYHYDVSGKAEFEQLKMLLAIRDSQPLNSRIFIRDTCLFRRLLLNLIECVAEKKEEEEEED